jgi:hypothetical protein
VLGELAKVLGHLSAGGRFPRHPSVIYVALNLKQNNEQWLNTDI